MENTRKSNLDFGTIAWGAFFILWGITEMFKSLPNGTGAVGIGVILVGLNMARTWKGQPTSGFTTTFGILALLLGGLELASPLPAPVLRAADLCDPAARTGIDRAGSCNEEARINDHELGWFSQSTMERKPSLPRLRSKN